MRNYGMQMQGKFNCELYISCAPGTWTSNDQGRIIYTNNPADGLWFGSSTGWVRVATADEIVQVTGDITSHNNDSYAHANMLSVHNGDASAHSLIITNHNANASAHASNIETRIGTHNASTNVHGITNTADLVRRNLGTQYGICVFDANGRDIVYRNGCSIDANGYLAATRVYNAVWNDYADYIDIENKIEVVPGKVYVMDDDGNSIPSSSYCQMGILGIATDTYGHAVGKNEENEKTQIPVSIGGFVLAYVDKVYPSGTPLTTSVNGTLTEIKKEDKIEYPERIVATFLKVEKNEEWNSVKVNGRHWVKIK